MLFFSSHNLIYIFVFDKLNNNKIKFTLKSNARSVKALVYFLMSFICNGISLFKGTQELFSFQRTWYSKNSQNAQGAVF